MKPCLSVTFALLLIAGAPTLADSETHYAAIKALGQINGIALHCRYIEQVRRMKAAVVHSAPKERGFGLAFDQATDEGFVAFVNAYTPCPGAAGFELQVTERIAALRAAFSDP